MYRRIIAVILSISFFLFPGEGVLAGEPPKESELYAKSAVLMDGDSGRVLYEKNGYEAMANASTTKILTCIIALENCDVESQTTVSSYAASQPKVHLGMREGQKFYLKDMLYGLMLESFNDCAVVIAEHIAGDVPAFAAMMNRKAEEIGCRDSHFITPNGLDGKDDGGFHHTTAADLALIMRYCIRQSPKAEEFLTVTQAASHSFSDVEGRSFYECHNHNAFLQMMEGALSGKTGFTGTAGYCYTGALERDGRTYIVALLACGWPNNKTYKWSDTKKLMNYGIENYQKKSVTELPPKEISPIPTAGGQGQRIGANTWTRPVVGAYEGTEQILLRQGEEVAVRYQIEEKLAAPVEKGDHLGNITYELNGEVIGARDVTAGNDTSAIDFGWCFSRVAELFSLGDMQGS